MQVYLHRLIEWIVQNALTFCRSLKIWKVSEVLKAYILKFESHQVQQRWQPAKENNRHSMQTQGLRATCVRKGLA
eukprot:860417-Amphidinium_carterae.1